jgi:hypothetical protein
MGMTLREEPMRCCFCGLSPEPFQYAELELRIEHSPAQQLFGAHRDCLTSRLAPGFNLELEPLDSQ